MAQLFQTAQPEDHAEAERLIDEVCGDTATIEATWALFTLGLTACRLL